MRKDYTYLTIYHTSTGEPIAKIIVRFEIIKKIPQWSTVQLEGFVLGKWMPLLRYDYAPKEKLPVHINKEYLGTDYKEESHCHPTNLIEDALKKLGTLTETQILDFIQKREKVFLKEGK